MPKITKRFVDALTVPEGKSEAVYWDDELPCFGVRMRASGTPTYICQFRNRAGVTRKVKIGVVGRLTPEEARRLARQALAAVDRGEYPAAERDAERSAMTVRDLCTAYLEACSKGLVMGKKRLPKKASTIEIDEGRIRRHILPLLGSRKVKDLVSADITRFMRDVAAGKTAVDEKTRPRGRAIVEGGKGTAARTVGLLGGILTYAVSEGIITINPVRGVKRPADRKRDVRMSEAEYRRLGIALDEAAQHGENPLAISFARLLCLTGCRRGEIEHLRWSEVDLAGRCFRLTDSKEGASVRPIGGPVLDLLSALPRSGAYVLAGTIARKPYLGFPKAWLRLAERAGLDGVTPHTLRHSFASVANDLGFTEPTIAAMLGHASGTVTGRYIHNLDSALTAAADRVARRIDAMMTGAEGAVVELATVRKR